MTSIATICDRGHQEIQIQIDVIEIESTCEKLCRLFVARIEVTGRRHDDDRLLVSTSHREETLDLALVSLHPVGFDRRAQFGVAQCVVGPICELMYLRTSMVGQVRVDFALLQRSIVGLQRFVELFEFRFAIAESTQLDDDFAVVSIKGFDWTLRIIMRWSFNVT